jgi:possible acetyltransferase
MSKLLIAMLENSKKKDMPFVFLTPINPKIYRKFGFEYFSNIEYYNFSVEELANFKLPNNEYSYIEINEKNKNLYLNDLIKIYNTNMRDNFSYLERNDFYFDKILKEAISDEMKAFILYKNKMASAYIIFGLYEENIEIRECLALDSLSYKEILALIYGYRDYYRNVSLASPNNSNLEFLFENQLNIEKIIKPFMMMRVLNPLAIFKNLKLENSNIKIYIEDKILKENTGLYSLNNEISFSNITEEKAVYDLKINIADLVFLITGYFSIDDLVKLGKINIKNKNIIKKLNKIFSKKNSYLYEFI